MADTNDPKDTRYGGASTVLKSAEARALVDKLRLKALKELSPNATDEQRLEALSKIDALVATEGAEGAVIAAFEMGVIQAQNKIAVWLADEATRFSPREEQAISKMAARIRAQEWAK